MTYMAIISFSRFCSLHYCKHTFKCSLISLKFIYYNFCSSFMLAFIFLGQEKHKESPGPVVVGIAPKCSWQGLENCYWQWTEHYTWWAVLKSFLCCIQDLLCHCISCHLIITLTCMKMLFCYLAENIITTLTATKYPFYWFFSFYFFFFSQHQEEKKIKWKICHRCCFVLAFSFQLYFSTIFSLFYSLAESQKLLKMKHSFFFF